MRRLPDVDIGVERISVSPPKGGSGKMNFEYTLRKLHERQELHDTLLRIIVIEPPYCGANLNHLG